MATRRKKRKDFLKYQFALAKSGTHSLDAILDLNMSRKSSQKSPPVRTEGLSAFNSEASDTATDCPLAELEERKCCIWRFGIETRAKSGRKVMTGRFRPDVRPYILRGKHGPAQQHSLLTQRRILGLQATAWHGVSTDLFFCMQVSRSILECRSFLVSIYLHK